jgi:hypothetical protein
MALTRRGSDLGTKSVSVRSLTQGFANARRSGALCDQATISWVRILAAGCAKSNKFIFARKHKGSSLALIINVVLAIFTPAGSFTIRHLGDRGRDAIHPVA